MNKSVFKRRSFFQHEKRRGAAAGCGRRLLFVPIFRPPSTTIFCAGKRSACFFFIQSLKFMFLVSPKLPLFVKHQEICSLLIISLVCVTCIFLLDSIFSKLNISNDIAACQLFISVKSIETEREPSDLFSMTRLLIYSTITTMTTINDH